MTKEEIYEKCKMKIANYWNLEQSCLDENLIIGQAPLLFREKYHFYELTTDYDYFFDDVDYLLLCHDRLAKKYGHGNFDFTIKSYCQLVFDCYQVDSEEIMKYLKRQDSRKK